MDNERRDIMDWEDNEMPMKGSLVLGTQDGARYRIVEMNKERVGLLNVDILEFRWAEFGPFMKDFVSSLYIKETEEQVKSAEPTKKEAEKVSHLVEAMEWYLRETYPAWENLFGHGAKDEIKEQAINKYNIPRTTFNRAFRVYMLSGRDQFALLDQRHFNGYEKRDPLKDDLKRYFPQALKFFKDMGPDASVSKVYRKMMGMHFSTHVFNEVTQKPEPRWLPEDQCPSEKQLRKYIEDNLGGLTITEWKKSQSDYANNNRPLIGSSDYGVLSIGQVFQIDEQEFDVPIVDTRTRESCIGKVVIYTAVDAASSCVMGVTVGLKNNAYDRLADLMMSMTEPHSREFARYGVDCDDECMPSCVIPHAILTDRGAEYMSTYAKAMCGELMIMQNPAPPGGASWKGLVEVNHKRVQNMLDPILRTKKDLNNKQRRYETARQESVLTISDITKAVYIAMRTLNRQSLPSITMTDEMIEAGVFPAPADVYGFLKKKNDPTNVTDQNRRQIVFATLRRANQKGNMAFRIDLRRGIVSGSDDMELQYTTEDYWFDEVRRSKTSDVDIRYTQDSMDFVYICFKGEIRRVGLAAKNTRMNRFRGKSFAEYDAEVERRKAAKKEEERNRQAERGEAENEVGQIKAKAELQSKGKSNTENIREARREEQEVFATSEDNIGTRLLYENFGADEEQEETVEETAAPKSRIDPDHWQVNSIDDYIRLKKEAEDAEDG